MSISLPSFAILLCLLLSLNPTTFREEPEKDAPWSGMLADVLRQQDIPFLSDGRLGAGLAVYSGTIRESIRFYVRWDDMERAIAIVEELFGENP